MKLVFKHPPFVNVGKTHVWVVVAEEAVGIKWCFRVYWMLNWAAEDQETGPAANFMDGFLHSLCVTHAMQNLRKGKFLHYVQELL